MEAGSWYKFKYRQDDYTVYIIKIFIKGGRKDILTIDENGEMRYFIGVQDAEISDAEISGAKWNEKIGKTLKELSTLPGLWRKFDQTKPNDGDICRFIMERYINPMTNEPKIEKVTGVYYDGKVYFHFKQNIFAVARGTIKEFTTLTKLEKEKYLKKLNTALDIRNDGGLFKIIKRSTFKDKDKLKEVLTLLLRNGFKCDATICKPKKKKKISGFKL